MKRTRTLVVISAAVAALGPAAVFTVAVSGFGRALQDQPAQPTFRTEANYVRVDVYPTKDGEPVTDLTQADFEVLESGQPQKIDQFEHVAIRAAGPQDMRIDPSTVAESRAMAERARARVFVLFLDSYHIEVDGSHNVRQPLVDALDRLIGADDLIAVMTPEMSAKDITFTRKTTTIDDLLTRYWTWSERGRMNVRDPEDEAYIRCYPNVLNLGPGSVCTDQNGIAAEMMDRRHEKITIEALRDLVQELRGVREERKAIIAITDGWLLYKPDGNLARPLSCHGTPTGPPVGVDPRTGKLTTTDPAGSVPENTCAVDRMRLSQIDDAHDFRDLLDEANRANASFYPVDPRGLAVFDTPLVRQDVPGPPPPRVSLRADAAMLTSRLTSLRTLADATDGLAIVSSNDLAGGLKRVTTDLSSYYLMGYYSTGKLDGKFHAITVRVKRPGVQVRARRGFLASTPRAMTAGATAAAAPIRIDAEAAAIASVLSPLSNVAREVPVRLQAVAGWKPDHAAAVWAVGELGNGDEWKAGAEADVMLTSAAGATLATVHATIAPSAHTFRAALLPAEPLTPGDYTISVRTRGAASTATANETIHLALPATPDAVGAYIVRRGISTGNKDVPTADLRFRRTEQIRVEVPTPESGGATARLLDRTGKPLAVPVAAAVRDDADQSRWLTAQLTLAPLAPGDYLIELGTESGGVTKRTLIAFRVVP